MPTPFVLDKCVVHLGPSGPITTALNTPEFWADRQRSELSRGGVLTVYEYERTWDYRELHPDGDELAVVLAGRAAVLLGEAGHEVPIDLQRGQGVVIPSNTWHRVAADERSTILFVTPTPATTQHETIRT